MATKVPGYIPVKGKDGKVRLEKDTKAAEAKLDVATRLQRRKSRRVKVAKRII